LSGSITRLLRQSTQKHVWIWVRGMRRQGLGSEALNSTEQQFMQLPVGTG
jgi:hypothetical protein